MREEELCERNGPKVCRVGGPTKGCVGRRGRSRGIDKGKVERLQSYSFGRSWQKREKGRGGGEEKRRGMLKEPLE